MPRKVRQVEADLRQAGFALRNDLGKGSHRTWVHPTGPRVLVSGRAGDDASPYQERQARAAMREVREREDAR